MTKAVSLAEIAESLLLQNADIQIYLHRQTGELLPVFVDALETARAGDVAHLRAYYEPAIVEEVRAIAADTTGEVYVPLPASYEIPMWHIMRDFAQSLEDADAREDLLDALHGRGAFRRFKDAVYRLGLEQDWFAYQARALQDIARAWCEEHSIPYTE